MNQVFLMLKVPVEIQELKVHYHDSIIFMHSIKLSEQN